MKTREVIFKNVEGRAVPCQPWPQSFFVSRELFMEGYIEVRPLTLMGLMKGVGRNFVTMNWWRLLRALWRMGFMATPEGCVYRLRDLRLAFWRPRPKC